MVCNALVDVGAGIIRDRLHIYRRTKLPAGEHGTTKLALIDWSLMSFLIVCPLGTDGGFRSWVEIPFLQLSLNFGFQRSEDAGSLIRESSPRASEKEAGDESFLHLNIVVIFSQQPFRN